MRRWLAAFCLCAASAHAGEFITVASTTSTEQSGLFRHLLPRFQAASGIEVRVVAVGTGQALDLARRGDADAVLVHDQPAEERFVAEGFGVKRYPVMYNDFVLVGPRGDPAGARGADIARALRAVAAHRAPFVSRGDRSGTHAAERRYWGLAGLEPQGPWYRETGAGMGPTLNTAAGLEAYTLADRASWLAFRNRAALELLVEGDTRLFNQYGVIVVNPARHPHVKVGPAQRFAEWLISPEGQATIGSYRINGAPAFFPAREKSGRTPPA